MPNCWEFMNCPETLRHQCPAYPNNGRDCWKMLSTKCNGGRTELASIQDKVAFCRQCRFYIEHASQSNIPPVEKYKLIDHHVGDKPAG